ncbi:related to nicotinamide mononucleotide permease [Ustilago trichophora]|uniref:Related to nicotinamide mononucleotide permease n=1 Tax=Ustilago trichophora TaxID=86804 RepID=A0A5C3ESY9_9BASI|nr:related to nicotinamide mononucleotide permease [Ustilago trichophora]
MSERDALSPEIRTRLMMQEGYDDQLVWTQEEENRIRRRTDLLALIPAMVVFITLSLDRSNVANALTDNFLHDLGMNQNQLNNAITIFNLGIVIFEIPWNILAKRYGPNRFLPITVILWGAVTVGQAWITNHHQLYVTRALVGTFEAGFIPGFAYYLGRFYRRDELAARYALFWSANNVASCIAGVASLGILKLRGTAGLAGWSWLFIIEGIFTMVAGIFALLWFPDGTVVPKGSKIRRAWYTERQGRIMMTRVLVDDPTKCNEVQRGKITLADIVDSVSDWRMLLIILSAFSGMIATTPVATYVPFIIKQLGFRGYSANGLAVPGYVAGIALSLTAGACVSKWRNHGYWVAAYMLGGICGFLWISLPPHDTLRSVLLVGALVMTAFSASYAGVMGSWISGSVHSRQRPIVLALLVMANNAAGLVGAQVLRASDAPRYKRGFLALVGTSAFGALTALAAAFALRRRNGPLHQ